MLLWMPSLRTPLAHRPEFARALQLQSLRRSCPPGSGRAISARQLVSASTSRAPSVAGTRAGGPLTGSVRESLLPVVLSEKLYRRILFLECICDSQYSLPATRSDLFRELAHRRTCYCSSACQCPCGMPHGCRDNGCSSQMDGWTHLSTSRVVCQAGLVFTSVASSFLPNASYGGKLLHYPPRGSECRTGLNLRAVCPSEL